MKMILSAIDFSDRDESVARTSVSLAAISKAKIRFIHVMDSFPVVTENCIPEPSYEKSIQVMKQHLLAQLEQHATYARSQGVQADCRLLFGIEPNAILAAALECSADLLVLGIHGHGAFHEIFGASVARSVLKMTTIPVLYVPCVAHPQKHLPEEKLRQHSLAPLS